MGVGVRLRVKHGPSEGVARRTPCACEEKGEEKISASAESGKISASLLNKQAHKVKRGGCKRRGQGWELVAGGGARGRLEGSAATEGVHGRGWAIVRGHSRQGEVRGRAQLTHVAGTLAAPRTLGESWRSQHLQGRFDAQLSGILRRGARNR